jgi:hypothetical protein
MSLFKDKLLLSSTMARTPNNMYAQLPVFQYEVIGQESFSFSYAPVSPPPTSLARYYGAVTDLAPKPQPVPEETPPEADETESPAESSPDPPPDPEGQHGIIHLDQNNLRLTYH